MARFVALLRGVNVGKGRRVPMADWRKALEALGCSNVRTLLNSGNAVFDGPPRATPASLATRIHDALAEALQVEVPVIVKSAADVSAAVAENTLAREATDPTRLLIAFTAGAADLAALSVLAPLAAPPERFVLGRHAAYLWCPQGILQSRAAEALLGKPGRAATCRNAATVARIVDSLA